jgi:hypothetical protein
MTTGVRPLVSIFIVTEYPDLIPKGVRLIVWTRKNPLMLDQGLAMGRGGCSFASMHNNVKHCVVRDDFRAGFCCSEELLGLHRIDKYLARAFWYTLREVLRPMGDCIPRSLGGSALGQRFGHRERCSRFSLDQRSCRSRAQFPIPHGQ